MDYYSNSRGGRSSYRGSSSSYRGSRGAPRGSRGFAPRGGRGSSSASYKPYDASQSSRFTSSSYDGSKYGSSSSSSYPYLSSHRPAEDYYSRRTESFGTREREHRSDLNDLASRKRDRSDSYSQGVSRRGPSHDDEYRSSASGSGRYSAGASEPSPSSRTYDDSRAFKKPRSEFKTDYKSEHRVKEPMRARPASHRGTFRGSFAPRRPVVSSYRGRGSFTARSATSGRANTSEILAIRRAKLLQKRLKEQGSSNGTDVKIKTEIKQEAGEDAVTAESADDAPIMGERGKQLMKLECPACTVKCITFREYATHLHQPIHMQAMQDKTDQLRATLASMRLKQRELQKQIDADDLESLSLDTAAHFCPVCKLNYSQDTDKHESSLMHKELQEILLPECSVCRIPFRSLVQYENHLCSLSHLKHKNAKEEREKRAAGGGGGGVLDKFITLDSVGSGDEGDEKEEGGGGEKGGVEGTGAVTAGAGGVAEGEGEAQDLILGAEFIHEVPAQFCEVCRKFLRPRRDKKLTIKSHCCTKEHLRAYLHYGSDELLEKIKNADNKEKPGESEEPLDESKLWDGLSEILDDGQPTHNDDDEDEEEGGRFDRINSKEKNENGETLALGTPLEAAEDVTSPDPASHGPAADAAAI